MATSKFDDLKDKYPDLINKAGSVYFGVDDGWYEIIDTLCNLISHDVFQAAYELQFAIEHPGNKYTKSIDELGENLAAAIRALPIIRQVKEKFGGLRFYVDGASERVQAYIMFAESMSYRTCEVCGNPGKKHSGDWIRTLCAEHHSPKLDASI